MRTLPDFADNLYPGARWPKTIVCANPSCQNTTRILGDHCDHCLRQQLNARIRLRLARAGKGQAS